MNPILPIEPEQTCVFPTVIPEIPERRTITGQLPVVDNEAVRPLEQVLASIWSRWFRPRVPAAPENGR